MLGHWHNFELPPSSIVGALIILATIAIALIGMLLSQR
jgi:hypothetical protein